MYPDEVFAIESVGIDLKNMEVTARIRDSAGVESTLIKKGNICSEYELDKAKSLIGDELAEVIGKSGLTDYIEQFDVRVFGPIYYDEIGDNLNPPIHLVIEYNDRVSGREDFARISHDVIDKVRKSKNNNVDTFVFGLTGDTVMNLTVYKEDNETDIDAFKKIRVAEEIKVRDLDSIKLVRVSETNIDQVFRFIKNVRFLSWARTKHHWI